MSKTIRNFMQWLKDIHPYENVEELDTEVLIKEYKNRFTILVDDGLFGEWRAFTKTASYPIYSDDEYLGTFIGWLDNIAAFLTNQCNDHLIFVKEQNLDPHCTEFTFYDIELPKKGIKVIISRETDIAKDIKIAKYAFKKRPVLVSLPDTNSRAILLKPCLEDS